MPVYVLREGSSNIFKIGRTSGSVDGVVTRLRTGNSQPLSIFETVQTDEESACEAFFHRQLRDKRVVRGGGWEFFEVDADEMKQLISQVRSMFEELREAQNAVDKLGKVASTDVLLDPNEKDKELLRRLLENKKEQEYLQIESQLLEAQLKKRIGTAAGLRGLATWKTQVTRVFDQKLFAASAPDEYERLLEKFHCLDTAEWKKNRPEEYTRFQTTYFAPRISRAFKLQKMA